MEMCITGYSAMENTIHSTWKSENSFPTSCKQCFPQLHKTASYTHSHNADDYGIIPIPHISIKEPTDLKGGGAAIKTVNMGYMVRAPTENTVPPLQLNTAAPQNQRSAGTAANRQAAFFIPENKINQI